MFVWVFVVHDLQRSVTQLYRLLKKGFFLKKTVLKDLSAVGSEFLLTIKKDRKNPCILKTEIPNYRVF